MNYRAIALLVSCIASVSSYTFAQDWPQWRGPNRDGKVAAFKAPESWPKELTQKWKVTVGDGVATPALVGDRVYVYGRQDGNEVLRCLDAATGDEVWQNQHPAEAVRAPASRFGGPRSSPTVAEEKVVVLGAQGVLSCLDAATGDVVWRNDEYEGAVPRFATSSSPIIVDGLCIAQLGSESNGGVMAFDLATGNEKWKWTEDGPAYGSPVLITVGDTKAVIMPTSKNMVALRVEDGKGLLKTPYTQGRYNAASPIAVGELVVYAGPTRGITAEKLQIDGEELTAEELWSSPDNSVQYNTPVVRDGLIFGLSNNNSLFCLNAQTGEPAWNAPVGAATGQPQAEGRRPDRQPRGDTPRGERPRTEGQRGDAQQGEGRGGRQQGGGQQGGRRGGRRGRGGGRGGYGSIVDAGSVLLALTPASELIVFKPSGNEYSEVAKYKVADSPTHAYPVVSGNRIFVKDTDSLTLWTVE